MANGLEKTTTLSGRGNEIQYLIENHVWTITWGTSKFKVLERDIEKIMSEFFKDEQQWYPLGASMTNPTKGGLGEYVHTNIPNLTPRHAAAIAAILYNEQIITVKGKKTILLKKLSKDTFL